MKSGNLNFLEPSGPLQACNGTALPIDKNTTGMPYLNIMPYLHKVLSRSNYGGKIAYKIYGL
jgi:hypothetical protein